MTFRHSVQFGLAVVLLVGGCSGNDVRQKLGMQRNQPDEFQVVSRPPLSVPPVYYLRPPSEDAAIGRNADERAQAIVFSGSEPAYQPPGASDPNYFRQTETSVVSVGESSLPTGGEEVFLRQAGVTKAQGDIRQVLAEENRPFIEEEKREKNLLDKLRGAGEGEEPVVDAGKERERILSNKEEGKTVNEGEVPVIDPKKKSPLQRIFE